MKIVYITHNLGGGIDHHLYLQSLMQPENDYFKIQPGKRSLIISVFDRRSREFKTSSEIKDYLTFASELYSFDQIQIHSVLGWDHGFLWVIAQSSHQKLNYIFHDYSLFAGESHLLISRQGEWQPSVTRSLHKIENVLIDRAIELNAPSGDTARRVSGFLGRNVGKMQVLEQPSSRIQLKQLREEKKVRKGYNVVIPGHMAVQKGAWILKRCVDLKNTLKLPINFIVLGKDLENKFQKHEVDFVGGYNQKSLHSVLLRLQPDIFWWPTNGAETFSYTLSELINSDLTKCVPNRGSFPERVTFVEDVMVVEEPDSAVSQVSSLIEALKI
jgi:hypothetical protein